MTTSVIWMPLFLLMLLASPLHLSGGLLFAQDKSALAPWDLETLYQAPQKRWISQEGTIHSLQYAGETYKGNSTEVFAFYASPVTVGDVSAEAGKKFPGVVLIHGGGGTAFAEWAWLWAKRGYCAIAMDLAGSRPIDPVYDATGAPKANQAGPRNTRQRLPNGGPNQTHQDKFDSIGGDQTDDWPWHAVSNVIRAHSLLRSFDEVDQDNTAVTGISWGGYTTCLVASVDDRFNAAVPVYGCGFLFEGESVQKPAIDKLGNRRQQWIDAYDPSSLLVHCQVPILFVNGTNDIHYPMDSYQKSYEVVPGEKQMRMEVKMPHGHAPGWTPQEIGLFIDSYCRDGKPLPIPGKLEIKEEGIELAYTSAVPLKSATLHYTTDTGLRSQRQWKSIPCNVTAENITASLPPEAANTWFIGLTDERDAMISTALQFE